MTSSIDSSGDASKRGNAAAETPRMHRGIPLFFVLACSFIAFLWLCAQSTISLDAEKLSGRVAKDSCNADMLIVETIPDSAMARLNADRGFQDLLAAESQKVFDEIRLRIEDENSCFHYRFLLVGGLLAGLLGFLAAGLKNSPRSCDAKLIVQTEESVLARLARSNATCTVLAIACIISLAIDIHVRTGVMSVMQISKWISIYVEPLHFRACGLDYHPAYRFYEGFLAERGKMHNDWVYSFVYWPHVQFFTFFIYALYLFVLNNLARKRFRARSHIHQSSAARKALPSQRYIAEFVFVLLQLTFLVFAFSAHYAPGAYRVKLTPTSHFSRGELAVLWRWFPTLILAVGLWHLYFRGSRAREAGGAGR